MDIRVILGFDFKSLNDEIVNSCLPQMLKESKKRDLQRGDPVADLEKF